MGQQLLGPSRAVGAGAGWGRSGGSWCWISPHLTLGERSPALSLPILQEMTLPGPSPASKLSSLSLAVGKAEVSAEQELLCTGKLDLFWDRQQEGLLNPFHSGFSSCPSPATTVDSHVYSPSLEQWKPWL